MFIRVILHCTHLHLHGHGETNISPIPWGQGWHCGKSHHSVYKDNIFCHPESFQKHWSGFSHVLFLAPSMVGSNRNVAASVGAPVSNS
jgi:hypothetical protein